MPIRLINRLFPSDLAITNAPAFRAYSIDFTTPQLRLCLWLALVTYAAFGFWDVFGEGGGVMTMRFRYLVACPVVAIFAAAGGSQFARTYRELFVCGFLMIVVTLVFGTVVLIDREFPFKISTGNATINYCLVSSFAFGLFPLLVLDGLLVGLVIISAHAILLYFYSGAGMLVNSFYVFHTIIAVNVGLFIAYWRERFIRSDFSAKAEIAHMRENSSKSGKIVISYRRDDSDAIAGRIRDRLTQRFGETAIFMDIDSIPFGMDFRSQIASALSETDILVAVVGNNWLGSKGSANRRIDDDNDPVRVELEIALRRGIPVVPVLVRGAKMPTPSDLPETLKEFSYRNAAEVEVGRDFHPHMERLIRGLERVLEERIGGRQSFAYKTYSAIGSDAAIREGS
jgi:TIR domain